MTGVEIVVARYNEDVAWLAPERGQRVTVYDKHEEQPLPHAAQRLPNVGREGHTYLHHIVQRYDDLADVTVFTQGDIREHVDGDPNAFLQQLVGEARRFGASLPRWRTHAPYDFRHVTYLGKPLDIADRCFGDWFVTYVRKEFPFPGDIAFYKNGIFAVSKALVRRRTVAYYARIRDTLLRPDPEQGHFLERAWCYVFGAV